MEQKRDWKFPIQIIDVQYDFLPTDGLSNEPISEEQMNHLMDIMDTIHAKAIRIGVFLPSHCFTGLTDPPDLPLLKVGDNE